MKERGDPVKIYLFLICSTVNHCVPLNIKTMETCMKCRSKVPLRVQVSNAYLKTDYTTRTNQVSLNGMSR